MPDPQQSEITHYLQTYRDAGLSFGAAKEKLGSQGYSEAAIKLASEYFPYDVKPIVKQPDKVEAYFEAHPDQAIEDGSNILKAQRSEEVQAERSQATLDIMASAASPRFDNLPTEPQLYFENKFATDVGVSFWLLYIVGGLINLGAYWLVYRLGLPGLLYIVNGLLTTGLIVYLIRRIR